jgi:hypothetical protein
MSHTQKKNTDFRTNIFHEFYSNFILRKINRVILIQNHPLWLLGKQIIFSKYFAAVYVRSLFTATDQLSHK